MWVVAVAVVGCAHKKAAAPQTSSIDLAGKHVSYRDWRLSDACKADPMMIWSDFEAMNAMLKDFLDQTKGSAEDVWTPEQIATLEAATTTLTPALDAVDGQISAVSKCKFPKTSGIEDDAKAADELAQASRKRLADAPALLPQLKAKVELNKWKADQAEAMKTGKESWCGAKPKPGTIPDIYYAAEDETGKTEWHFCDDTKVFSLSGAKPEVASDDPKKKKPNAKGYVDAALKYPASEVQHAPKPGEKAAEGDKSDKPQG